MKTFTMKLPELETRKCWIGVYGGHFNIVVIFSEKPTKCLDGEYYDYGRKVAGSFDFDTFVQWFGKVPRPKKTYIDKVEEVLITANWDDYGRIIGLNPQAD